MPVSLAVLPDNLDWMMRPVLSRVCKYESLVDGTLDLSDVRLLNSALDYKEYNERKINEYNNRNKK